MKFAAAKAAANRALIGFGKGIYRMWKMSQRFRYQARVFVMSFVITLTIGAFAFFSLTAMENSARTISGSDRALFALEGEGSHSMTVEIAGHRRRIDLTGANIAAYRIKEVGVLLPREYRAAKQLDELLMQTVERLCGLR